MDETLRICLIEDAQSDIDLVELAFARQPEIGKYEITTLRDGREAICYFETLGTVLPNLILLNLSLPHVSGVDVKAYIESQRHLRDIPLVVISGYDKPANISTGSFVPKVRDFNDFVLRLMSAVNHKMARIG